MNEQQSIRRQDVVLIHARDALYMMMRRMVGSMSLEIQEERIVVDHVVVWGP